MSVAKTIHSKNGILYRYTIYKYDNLGRNTGVAEINASSKPSESQIEASMLEYVYDIDDNITKIYYPNTEKDKLKGISFKYNKDKWITEVDGILSGNRICEEENGITTSYTYNDFDQLAKSVERDRKRSYTTRYKYDEKGNQIKVIDGKKGTVTENTYDVESWLVSTRITNNGEIIATQVNNLFKSYIKKCEQMSFEKNIDEIEYIKKKIADINVNKISKEFKVKKGYNTKGEHYWYTNSTCFRKRFHLKYMFANTDFFESLEEYEYQGNEFYYEGNNKIDKLICLLSYLIAQLKNIVDHKFIIQVYLSDLVEADGRETRICGFRYPYFCCRKVLWTPSLASTDFF